MIDERVERVPQTMRAAVLHGPGDLRIEQRPVPALEPGDMLVRTGACGICSSDLLPWYVRRKAPFVLGHEPAGTVVAVGAAESAGADLDHWLGARVFAHHHAPCLRCASCERGDYVQCAQWRASTLDPGGMAEFFRVPRANRVDVLRLPGEMSFVAGSLVEPLACVVKSLRRGSGVSAPASIAGGVALADAGRPLFAALTGRSVYVVGLGAMGLMHLALASAFGAVAFGSDFHAARRQLADRLGAATFDPTGAFDGLRDATGGRGPDIVVCGPGTAAALDHSLEAVARGGTVVLFTPHDPKEPYRFHQAAAYFGDLRIVGSYSCGPDDTRAALALLAARVVTPEMLGVETSSFGRVKDAFDAMQTARVTKSVVLF